MAVSRRGKLTLELAALPQYWRDEWEINVVSQSLQGEGGKLAARLLAAWSRLPELDRRSLLLELEADVGRRTLRVVHEEAG